MSIHSVVMDKKNNGKYSDTSDAAGEQAASSGTMAAKPTVGGGGTSSLLGGSLTVSAAGSGSASSSLLGPGLAVSAPGTRQHNALLSVTSTRARELEDPEIKAYLKAHAARALCTLATGNAAVCKSITESRALLCLSVLLEKSTGDVQYNSAMALMEICRVAEQNAELRRSAFKPTSPAACAVVDPLLRAVDKADYDELLNPCITYLGCLSRTFRATETRIIGPLVKLLDDREAEVTIEASAALAKFACAENYLHVDHSKAIIDQGGAKHLVQLVYFGEQTVKMAALPLMCYIAHNVPDSEELAQAETLTVLEWASKQGYMSQDPVIESLLPEAKIRMELFQFRGAKGYY